VTTAISTDLLTPLGAYLRLREHGRAAFLLESVERGRLGRYSLVGCGSRIVELDEAETIAEPVVGYVGYEYAARIEPTVPVPEAGPSFPQTRFVVADMLVRFDHALGTAEVVRGDAAILHAAQPAVPPSNGGRSGPSRRFPDQQG
jgi:anthranilate/para-aminobenzoate synthase component I